MEEFKNRLLEKYDQIISELEQVDSKNREILNKKKITDGENIIINDS